MSHQSGQRRSSKQTQAHRDEFNEGASPPGAGRDTPYMTKAQLVRLVSSKLPTEGTGGMIKSTQGEELIPTKNQRALMRAIDAKPVVMVQGTFGTGKTMWTCYKALQGLADGTYTQIALNAPAVEAGEQIGFLKGDLKDKMLPHVNQILESFDDFIGKDLRDKLVETGVIKIEPHAFLRGRSMKNTFFIFDECQNATGPNLMTALSRLGNGSTFVFMGDNKQNDRTQADSAFVAFIDRFTKDPDYSEYVGHAQLTKEDVRRHPFLKLIVEKGDDKPLDGHERHVGPSTGARAYGGPGPV